MIIDDNARFRVAIGRLLRQAGFDVLEAGDGRAGLDLFRLRGADVVISDIYMPGYGGLPTIELLRREAGDVKIIAMSAADGAAPLNLATRSVALGADRFLRKPFGIGELLSALERLLWPVALDSVEGSVAVRDGGAL